MDKVVFYVKQFAVLNNIIKNLHFTELKVTRLLLDGEIWTQP